MPCRMIRRAALRNLDGCSIRLPREYEFLKYAAPRNRDPFQDEWNDRPIDRPGQRTQVNASYKYLTDRIPSDSCITLSLMRRQHNPQRADSHGGTPSKLWRRRSYEVEFHCCSVIASGFLQQ